MKEMAKKNYQIRPKMAKMTKMTKANRIRPRGKMTFDQDGLNTAKFNHKRSYSLTQIT